MDSKRKKLLHNGASLVLALFLFSGMQYQCRNEGLMYLPTGTFRDLMCAAWKPGDAYALVAGNGVFRYDGNRFKMLSLKIQGNAVAWKPDGSYALIVGNNGSIIKYDEKEFIPIPCNSQAPLNAVSWAPDGSYALIVGYAGAILKYNGLKLEDVSVMDNGLFLEGVDFKPDGSYALIAGIRDYANLMVYTYDGTELSTLLTGESVWPSDVKWDMTGDYALISLDWGHVLKFDGEQFVDMDTGMWQKTDGLDGIDFSPESNAALIVGAWSHQPLKPYHTVLLYKDGTFSTLLNKQALSPLVEAAWRHDGQYALIVGRQGTALKYTP